MQLFAITPDHITQRSLHRHLPLLALQGVTHLYLRSASLKEGLPDLCRDCRDTGIMPCVPVAAWHPDLPAGTGIHFKSRDKMRAPFRKGQLRSASVHSDRQAARTLEKGVDYVFLSPVFRPISKPEDRRPCIPLDTLIPMLAQYGERIILLGGMTHDRIRDLKHALPSDFSVGGIRLFFPENGPETGLSF